ncbi:MAG: OmpA family protein [Acidobacteriaceae bacterium]|nr:OmpA family protein [Acidobacteriaceae bacterium]
MKHLPGRRTLKTWLAVSVQTCLASTLLLAVTPSNTKTFNSGEKAKIKGVILSKDGSTLKVRGDDDSIDTVDLTDTTKIQLRHGMFGKNAMDPGALVPGLHVEAQGRGNDKGDLVADKVLFDPNSMRASRQIDARVSPLEARTNSVEGRTGQLEGRAGQLENRAGQLENRQGDLENTEKQTQQQVSQVRTTADQANQGVNQVNGRVSNLDNYASKEAVTVYFRSGSAVLSTQAKQDLDNIAQQAKNEKGYAIEVAGFADTTGNAAFNQDLSQRRAGAVITYLEEKGDIPIHRILPASGLGTTHEAADNHTSAGRKLNRRVEVKILVNQGLVSSNAGATNATGQPVTTGVTDTTGTQPNSTATQNPGQGTTPPPQPQQ